MSLRAAAQDADSAKQETALVECETSAGPFALRLERTWSPRGYDRAVELFERGFYDHGHFFRVAKGFVVQFGISYSDDKDLLAFADSSIPDDPPHNFPIAFQKGIVSFAGAGPNTRTSQLFITYSQQDQLGQQPWETPIGKVVHGMVFALEKLYSGYGDMPPWGHGPVQDKIRRDGAEYIERYFPLLDRFNTCTVKRMPKRSPEEEFAIRQAHYNELKELQRELDSEGGVHAEEEEEDEEDEEEDEEEGSSEEKEEGEEEFEKYSEDPVDEEEEKINADLAANSIAADGNTLHALGLEYLKNRALAAKRRVLDHAATHGTQNTVLLGAVAFLAFLVLALMANVFMVGRRQKRKHRKSK